MNMNPRLNSSGCRDPVAFEAIGRVIRQERNKKKKTTLPKVYICSPFRGDTKTNTANAIKYCRFALKCGKFPIATHIWFPLFMDDDNPDERQLALKIGLWLLRQCGEVWVFGDRISEGMAAEIKTAKKQDKQIKYFNENMEEISND